MNAEALQRSGAGLRLLPEEITPEAVSEHAHALLTEPRYRTAARRIAGEIALMPAPAAVVPALERIAGRVPQRNAGMTFSANMRRDSVSG
jgi:UDP:flavonoid glycosyltransferase YjiC (YdhE family)